MPYGDDLSSTYLRQLAYGRPKTRKTWWALNAAVSGFNVLIFDGDNGAGIVSQLPAAARKRVRIISCKDKAAYPVFADFVSKFFQNVEIKWDDTESRVVTLMETPREDHPFFVIKMDQLTGNDVLIIDSWTALAYSTMWHFYKTRGVDITEIDKGRKSGTPRDAYEYEGRILSWFLKVMQSAPCNVIVIGHEMVRELTKKEIDPETKKPVDTPIGEQRLQPISSSQNHGGSLAQAFSEVLYFEFQGGNLYIDSRGMEGRDGGSRLLHDRGKWDEMQLARFAAVLGIKPVPDAPMPGCVYYKSGKDIPKQVPKGAAATVVLGRTSPVIGIPSTGVQPIPIVGGGIAIGKK